MIEKVEIEKVDNGYIVKFSIPYRSTGKEIRVFSTFDEVVSWIKEVYEWNGEEEK